MTFELPWRIKVGAEKKSGLGVPGSQCRPEPGRGGATGIGQQRGRDNNGGRDNHGGGTTTGDQQQQGRGTWNGTRNGTRDTMSSEYDGEQ